MSPKPTKMKRYDSFADWEADQSQENRELIDALKRLIGETVPDLTTTVKWGQGCWMKDGNPKAYIHAEEDHVQLGFYNGSSLKDTHGLLSGNGKYVRFIRVRTVEDIEPETFSELIKQAVK